jgi:hypothetical protein
MFKGKFVVLSLIAAALLCWQVLPMTVNTVNSGIVDACSSSASSIGGCWLICPQGDGDRLDASGATISVVVKDQAGAPIPGIPAADFWLMGCTDPGIVLCGGGGSINAAAATDVNGETTIAAAMAAGGCDVSGVVVVVRVSSSKTSTLTAMRFVCRFSQLARTSTQTFWLTSLTSVCLRLATRHRRSRTLLVWITTVMARSI